MSARLHRHVLLRPSETSQYPKLFATRVHLSGLWSAYRWSKRRAVFALPFCFSCLPHYSRCVTVLRHTKVPRWWAFRTLATHIRSTYIVHTYAYGGGLWQHVPPEIGDYYRSITRSPARHAGQRKIIDRDRKVWVAGIRRHGQTRAAGS